MANQYKCEVCGKFINEEDGITAVEGEFVCDNDSCRHLDEENQAYANETSYVKKIDALQQQSLEATKVLLAWSIKNVEMEPEQCRKNIETVMQHFKLI